MQMIIHSSVFIICSISVISFSMPSLFSQEILKSEESVFFRSALFSTATIGTSSKSFFICSSILYWSSSEYPQVSDGSKIKTIMSARWVSAAIACFSISFLLESGLSKSPGVSIIWYVFVVNFSSILICPTMTCFVVKGYVAISGFADDRCLRSDDYPTFG